ncbi:flippase [Streptococcus macacae]|uniref:Polysaccharide biosynthesis protein n=1 Tax=Streptococcus macacae NCTC 11558 TaxID=764298 RepID=G5JUJ2_9STRE|nr:flippase [Streptococcus macacae]EHJ52327.1 polysaccharide biosynthesis protein [Streptococcus macacae NCTC 11558]SUN78634.1 flippase Wzx [Streptococcus macacae NCTC 11558]
MNRYNSVRFNFIMNFLLTVSNFIFPLITFPYASRVLQAQGVGAVTFATSNISYFTMVGMMGIPTYGIRACAKVREDRAKLSKTVQEIFFLNAIVTAFALLALAVSVLTVEKMAQEKMLYLIMSSTLIFNVLGVEWLYKALEKYSYITIRSILFKLLSLILLLLLVRSKGDYVIYGAITVLAGVGSNLMNFLNLRKLVTVQPIRYLNLIQHIKPCLTFFLLTVSTTIYLNMDTSLLGFIKGDHQVGYYSAAVKVKQILVSVVTSLGAVLLPRLSFYHEQQKHMEFKLLVEKALSFVFVLSVPLTLFFIIDAKESILFLSGTNFLPAILPMQLLMPTVLFIGISNLMGMQILVPTQRERLVVISTIIGAIVDVLLNIMMIPLFGAAGAAIVGSLAELTVVLVQLYFLRDLILPMLKRIGLWKIALSSAAAIIVTVLFKNTISLRIFFMLVSTGFIFFAIYGLGLLLTKEKFTNETLRSMLGRFKFK